MSTVVSDSDQSIKKVISLPDINEACTVSAMLVDYINEGQKFFFISRQWIAREGLVNATLTLGNGLDLAHSSGDLELINKTDNYEATWDNFVKIVVTINDLSEKQLYRFEDEYIQIPNDEMPKVLQLAGTRSSENYEDLLSFNRFLIFARHKNPISYEGKRIFISGCGTGAEALVCKELGAQYCLGHDTDQTAIEFASKRFKDINGVSFTSDLPQTKGDFDLVISRHVFEHLPRSDRREYFVELGNLLKINGEVLIDVPNQNNPREPHTDLLFFHLLSTETKNRIVEYCETTTPPWYLLIKEKMKALIDHRNIELKEIIDSLPVNFLLKNKEYIDNNCESYDQDYADGIRIILQKIDSNNMKYKLNIFPSSFYFAITISFLHLFIMSKMFLGDFLNSYVFISPDGYDYIFEGLALKQLLLGINNAPWPILRNPGFVFVTFLDALLNANGKVIIGVQGVAIFTILTSLAWIGKRYGHAPIVILACLFGLSFMPLGYFYFWVLSDTLCMALMMVSVALLIYFNDSQKKLFLMLAFIFSLAAGLTQTYGMIPFVILTSLLFLDYVIHNRNPRWQLLFAGIVSIVLWGILQKTWEIIIPHLDRPQNFELLDLGIGMATFYYNVWGFTLLPLVPVILIMLVKSLSSGFDLQAMWLKLGVVILFFVSLTFFYQWKDTRFTFIYIPLVFTMLFSIIPKARPSQQFNWFGVFIAISGIIYGLVGFMIAPVSYWGPELSTLKITPYETWINQAWLAVPNDRFQLVKNCNNLYSFCEQAMVSTTQPYENKILTAYKTARLLQQP
jgi:SAM-dependent methyltransferase